jgi:hypothetical protein
MSYLHDATPTWNGFNYQGKIALYVVLDKLIELNNVGVVDYSLELEWFEDFTIKKNNEYITIHQVKNYDNDNLGDYKNALSSLLVKTLQLVTNDELKYSITKHNDNKDALAEIIFTDLVKSNIITNQKKFTATPDFNNLGLSTQVLDCQEKLKYKLIQLFQVAKNSGNLQKCYLHIAEPLKGTFDAASIKILDTISQYNACAGFDEALNKMELYDYRGTNNCNNSDIITRLDVQIKKYLTDIRGIDVASPQYHNDNVDRIRYYLLNVIDDNISKRHQAIRDGKANIIENISFTAFKSILDNENLVINDYYHSFQLREAFSSNLDSTLELFKANPEKCQLLLDLANNIYYLYPAEKFIDFCFKIKPQTNAPINYYNLIDENGLRDAFFKFFSEYLSYNEGAFIKDKFGNYSLITSISEANFVNERVSQVYSNIRKNEKYLPPLMFNIDTLVGNIGAGNGGKKFSEIIPKITTAGDGFNDSKSSSRITISEDFKIVDITDEINRLKPPVND